MSAIREPNKRCVLEDGEAYICFCIEGNEALDYSGRCFSCGDKMAITPDEQNQTEYDAARAYLIKEGLDPDQLAKEGTVFIKAIQEQIRLTEQLAKERKLRKELVESLIYISKTLGGLTLPQDEPEALAYNEALKAIKKGT